MDLKARQLGYRCINCGTVQPEKKVYYSCFTCNANLDVMLDYSNIAQTWSKDMLDANPDRSIWRYLPLLPVNSAPDNHSIDVGNTPLVDASVMASELGLRKLYVKDDTRNPSGSLKDRATEVGLRHAVEAGYNTIVAASTGNAAASLAALSACYGMKAIILAPAAAPAAKLTQILQHKARLILVDGTYDDAFDLSLDIADKYGFYSRSTGINPVLSEGKKTVSLEIAEQLRWHVPDYVLVPVGDGCIIGGVYKGFYDLREMEWIERMPRIIGVQSAGSAAIVNAWKNNTPIASVQAETVADSISVDLPRDGRKALRAIKSSHGFGLTVTDAEILSAQHNLSAKSGIFAEPAGAATYAGLLKAVDKKRIKPNSSVVILATGSGLKDISTARQLLAFPDPIAPDISAFDRTFNQTVGK